MQKWLRLCNQRDFQRLRQDGKVQRSSELMMSYATNHLAHNRYGVIVPKRVGNAVKRNRLRRQVREILRQMHPFLRQGFDLVIIIHPRLKGQPFHTIQRILYRLCDKADLLVKEL